MGNDLAIGVDGGSGVAVEDKAARPAVPDLRVGEVGSFEQAYQNGEDLVFGNLGDEDKIEKSVVR